jgi:hypothetical protein
MSQVDVPPFRRVNASTHGWKTCLVLWLVIRTASVGLSPYCCSWSKIASGLGETISAVTSLACWISRSCLSASASRCAGAGRPSPPGPFLPHPSVMSWDDVMARLYEGRGCPRNRHRWPGRQLRRRMLKRGAESAGRPGVLAQSRVRLMRIRRGRQPTVRNSLVCWPRPGLLFVGA